MDRVPRKSPSPASSLEPEWILLVRLLKAGLGLGRKPAVLMNEAGAISVDGPLAQTAGANIDVMNVLGGCICCTSAMANCTRA